MNKSASEARENTAPRPLRPTPFATSSTEVMGLIDRARGHALGLDFLLTGSLDSVSATFGVHAFVVDEARDHLRNTPEVTIPNPAAAKTT